MLLAVGFGFYVFMPHHPYPRTSIAVISRDVRLQCKGRAVDDPRDLFQASSVSFLVRERSGIMKSLRRENRTDSVCWRYFHGRKSVALGSESRRSMASGTIA